MEEGAVSQKDTHLERTKEPLDHSQNSSAGSGDHGP